MKNKFLKVVSIILIVLGAIGLVSGIVSLTQFSKTNETLVSLGMDPLPVWYSVIGLIDPAVELVAGIIGLMYKSRNMVKIMGIVYLVVFIITLGLSAYAFSAGIAGIVGIIFPILYLVGWSKSE